MLRPRVSKTALANGISQIIENAANKRAKAQEMGLEAPLEQPISQEWIVMKAEEVYSSAYEMAMHSLEKRQHDHEKAPKEKERQMNKSCSQIQARF